MTDYLEIELAGWGKTVAFQYVPGERDAFVDALRETSKGFQPLIELVDDDGVAVTYQGGNRVTLTVHPSAWMVMTQDVTTVMSDWHFRTFYKVVETPCD